MQMKTYRVLRDHIGDEGKLYSPHGEFDTRTASPNDVAHLVPQTLMEIEQAEQPAAEVKKAPAAKAAVAAPENKAEQPAAEVKKEA